MGVLNVFAKLISGGVDKDLARHYASESATHGENSSARALDAQGRREAGHKVTVGQDASGGPMVTTSRGRKRGKRK